MMGKREPRVFAARLPRGRRASIGVAVAEVWSVSMLTGRRELTGWTVHTSAAGRREMVAFLPYCPCERQYVCTLTHQQSTFAHHASHCHAKSNGYHFEHVAVYVGKVLASYGCTGVRRPKMLPAPSVEAAIGKLAA